MVVVIVISAEQRRPSMMGWVLEVGPFDVSIVFGAMPITTHISMFKMLY